MIELEDLVRELMTDETEGLYLAHDAASRALRGAARPRLGRARAPLVAGLAAAITVGAAGVAAATGVLPWWSSVQAVESSPFATSPDPAVVPGSTVRLSLAGPSSTTFEIVAGTVTAGTDREQCTAIAAKDAQGRSRHLMTSCGAPGAAVARTGSFEWQAPSGVTYAILAGPSPTSTAATVALLMSDGLRATSGPVEGGYYLVYVPAPLSTGSLVFYDLHGQVVDRLALHPHP